MSDLKYIVDIVFQTGSASTASLRGISGAAGAFRMVSNEAKLATAATRTFLGAGAAIGDAFTGMVESAGGAAWTAMKIGAVAAIGGIAYAVGGLNSEMERAQISIAGMLESTQQARSFEDAMGMSQNLIAQMRKDAKVLPGEFGDLLQIFDRSSMAAANAGVNAEQLRVTSAKVMALGIPRGQSAATLGNQLSMLLAGQARQSNLARMLGVNPSEFNKLSGEKRFEEINRILDKHKGEIEAYTNTFDALSSTLIDNAKLFALRASGPLFERIKYQLKRINSWFDENQDLVNAWADKIGTGLAKAFDRGVDLVERWWPAISQFASDAYTAMSDIWTDVKPVVYSIGETIRTWALSGELVSQIKSLFATYVALKAAGGMGSIVSLATGVGDLVSGGAGAAAGGAAAGGATAQAASTGLVASVGGVGYALALLGTAVYEGLNAFTFFKAGVEGWTSETGVLAGVLTAATGAITGPIPLLISYLGGLGAAAGGASSALNAIAAMFGFGSADKAAGHILGAMSPQQQAAAGYNASTGEYAPHITLRADAVEQGILQPFGNGAKSKAGGGGGGGALKVEVTINSNQAPGQISRALVDELRNRARHPRSSVFVRQFANGLG